MIPYFQVNYFLLGPLTIQVWGLLVAAGVISAVVLGRKLARKYLLSEDIFLDMVIGVLFGSILFARVFHILFYDLEFYAGNPSEILKFWHGGASSLGGFFGAFLVLYIFSKVRHFSLKEYYPYLDIAAISLWLGWGIGRLGCFIIHDHPGIISNFFLAVKFPAGSRLDLGLLESIFAFGIFAVYYYFFEKLIKKKWGLVSIYSLMTYAVGRFFLDFLRARDLVESDARYYSLTPAQWGMIALLVTLTLVLFSDKIKRLFIRKDD